MTSASLPADAARPADAPRASDPAASRVSLISLISVTYQSADLVAGAIDSVVRAAARAGTELEIIVVDNASRDGSADKVARIRPDATLFRNTANVGFGRACNQGFERARGDWWLLLNPDARLDEGALAVLVRFMAGRERAGAVGASMYGAGTERAESAGMLPGLRSALGHFLFLDRFLPGDRGGAWRGIQLQRRPGHGPRRVEWASAGALLLRPAAVREVGGFDPALFLYAEDVDLGRRLGEAGWETWLLPDARATHSVAASHGGVTDRWMVALHDDYARRASPARVVAFDLIAALGLGARALAASFVAASLGGADPQGRLHARRMRVAALAALRLIPRAVSGR